MLRFEQTKDALNHIHSFHQALSQYYQDLSKHVPEERTRMALHYLAEHEQKSAKEINDYTANANNTILNTWFQYTNDEALLKIPFFNEQKQSLSIDDIATIAGNFGNQLIRLYEDLMKQSDTNELRDVFENLSSTQVQMNKQLSVTIDRMMDI